MVSPFARLLWKSSKKEFIWYLHLSTYTLCLLRVSNIWNQGLVTQLFSWNQQMTPAGTRLMWLDPSLQGDTPGTSLCPFPASSAAAGPADLCWAPWVWPLLGPLSFPPGCPGPLQLPPIHFLASQLAEGLATLFCKSGILIFIFAENNYSIYAHAMLIKTPLLHQSFVPCVFLSFLSLSISISGWFPGARKLAA